MNFDNNNHLNKDWHILICEFLAGKTSSDEDQELKRWIDEDPGNYELFELYRNIWLSTSAKTGQDFYNVSKAWQQVGTTLNKEETGIIHERKFISGAGVFYFLKIAAFFVLIFSLGFLFSRLFNEKRDVSDKQYTVINTPLGSKTHLVLSDSTEVWLNAGSTLSYPTQSESNQRNVSLAGEAFFEVKPDKSKPFIVNTRQMDIRATGTSFNVKAYDEDTLISALLLEGSIKVNIKANQDKSSYTLKPDQILTFPDHRSIDSEAQSQNIPIEGENVAGVVIRPKIEMIDSKIAKAIVSWKDEQWIIEGELLSTLAILLERRYNIKIHIVSDLLKDYRFSGIIKNETLEQVLQYLKYTTPLKYEIGKGEVWWDIDPELAITYTKILEKK